MEYLKYFVQLSEAGMTIWVLYKLGIKFFEYLRQRNGMETDKEKRTEKLYNKFAEVAEGISKALLKMESNQGIMKMNQDGTDKLICDIFEILNSMASSVVRIDVRTQYCLGDPKQKEVV